VVAHGGQLPQAHRGIRPGARAVSFWDFAVFLRRRQLL
jgi:hypothetical protein